MEKFHPIWKLYEGTSFTKLHSGQKLWKTAQGARKKGLSSSLVSIGDLPILIILPIFISNGIRNKALPLQNFREGRNLHWIMCQILNWGTWDEDGTSDYIARRSSTIYVRIFSAIIIVVPLESGRNAILVLNRNRHFSIFNYGQYLCQSLD